MKPNRRVFILGGAHTTYMGRGRPEFVHRRHPDYGTRTNPGLEDHLGEAVHGALTATGVDAGEIDRGVVSNFLAECFCRQGHLGSMFAAVDPAFDGKPFLRVEPACASGSAAVISCVEAMQAGVDVTLAVGVEVETNRPGKEGVDHMALAAHWDKQRDFSQFLFPFLFGRRAKAYKEAFGATDEALARVVAKAYANASRNPQALNQSLDVSLEQAMTVDDHNYVFLEDEALRPHMKLHDCTAFTDGASAVILATEDGLKRLGKSPADCTELTGYGWSVRALGAETDPTRMSNMADAAAEAYGHAAIDPGDIDVVELHDCFSISELQQVEALGLADAGGAPALMKDGATELGGRVPVNTGGDLLGFGHPIGATGVKQILEIHRQLAGKAGAYQLSSSPQVGVCANLGGDDRTGIVTVQRAPAS
ncbi:MAG: hypothetical protein GY898_21260 [Proteobacteria bacterium]|nr:hypothetical protein [Pseudomonadota bacterium]